ncbi:MAG: SRPBCC domain-containing protein [Bacteroidota bacterium]
MFNSKILLVVFAIVAVLVILYFTGKKSVHHEIPINAAPEKVWSVLMDTDAYDQWNPVMHLLEGKVKEGNTVKYRFTQDEENVSEMGSKVKQIISEKLLNQGGGMPLVITFDHKYILEPTDSGTKLTIHEDYAGIYVNFWNPKPVEEAYQRLNEALKKRVESLNQ